MPMKRAGCRSALAIELTPMPEVLVAMIASGSRCPSIAARTSRLRSRFSGMVSSTRPAPASAIPRSGSKATDPPGALAASIRSRAWLANSQAPLARSSTSSLTS